VKLFLKKLWKICGKKLGSFLRVFVKKVGKISEKIYEKIWENNSKIIAEKVEKILGKIIQNL